MNDPIDLRITVRGHLSDRIAAAFDGLHAVPRVGVTDLVGEVADQAHVHGLLTRVRDLGLVLVGVSITRRDEAPSVDERAPRRSRR